MIPPLAVHVKFKHAPSDCFEKLGVGSVGVLIMRAQLFVFYMRAPILESPIYRGFHKQGAPQKIPIYYDPDYKHSQNRTPNFVGHRPTYVFYIPVYGW